MRDLLSCAPNRVALRHPRVAIVAGRVDSNADSVAMRSREAAAVSARAQDRDHANRAREAFREFFDSLESRR